MKKPTYTGLHIFALVNITWPLLITHKWDHVKKYADLNLLHRPKLWTKGHIY